MHSGHKGCSISIDVEFQLLNEESEEAQFSKLISQLQSTMHSCKIMLGPFSLANIVGPSLADALGRPRANSH